MQIKKVIKGDEARQKLFNGLSVVADSASVTLGPAGRNVAIQQSYGPTRITKDGVTVCKSIFLADTAENEGAKMMINASEKTNRIAGDATTTTCVIAKAIAQEGLKLISKGIKSTDIKKGIDKAVETVVEDLKCHSKVVSSNDEIRHIATVSANGDTEIGNFIADAIEKVGRTGVVTVEEGKGLKNELEIVEGMQLDQGYLSPYFMTNPERQLVEFDNPYIFLYDGKINSLTSILPLLEAVQGSGKPLVIIADEVDDEPLAAMVLNHTRGVLRSCAIKAPSVGDWRKFIMEDIAVLTGGEFISTAFGKKLDQLDESVLGTCDKIKVTPTETIIIGGHGDQEALKERIDSISTEIKNVESSYDKEKLEERLAKLTGGVAIIKVGAATEVEMKEVKDRVDDAICATKAALEEGILPGGGIALLRSRKSIDFVGKSDETLGMQIVCDALEKPLKTIVENAGKSGEVVIEKVTDGVVDYNYGYDARNDKYCDLVESGIVDATKVVRCSLENGASIAGSLLTVESLIIDDVDENLKMIKGLQPAPQMM